MRKSTLLFAIFSLVTLGVTPVDSSPTYSLKIIYKADQESSKEVSSLECKPAGGTINTPGVKCARLLKISSPFAPINPDQICSQIFGGTETARIYGYWQGKKINARFSKSNGCQIERWNRVEFLFPKK